MTYMQYITKCYTKFVRIINVEIRASRTQIGSNLLKLPITIQEARTLPLFLQSNNKKILLYNLLIPFCSVSKSVKSLLRALHNIFLSVTWLRHGNFNPLSANPTKRSSRVKQFVAKLPSRGDSFTHPMLICSNFDPKVPGSLVTIPGAKLI